MRGNDKASCGHALPNRKAELLGGSLIVIEGTDGVGRSRQIDQLIPWLEARGHAVTRTGWARSPLLSETLNEAKAGHALTVTTISLLYAADFADRLANEIMPALRAGCVVVADRYLHTVFARNAVMGADRDWTRELLGCAPVPDLVLYLDVDVDQLVPRILEDRGMDYGESGMHLRLDSDVFESFRRYQTRLIREYRRLAREFQFVSVDARRPVHAIQTDLRRHLSAYLKRGSRRRIPHRAAAGHGAGGID